MSNIAQIAGNDNIITLNKETSVISFEHNGQPDVVRARIRKLTTDLLALPKTDQKEFEVKNTFHDGVYTRELFIPKGSLLVGKIHKLDCLNIVSKGDISILTENGSGRITAGHSAISKAGIQKVGFANEDTVFVNVFRTDETDLEKIENVVAYADYEEFDLIAPNSPLIEGEEICL